jgi:hypothetical protein
MRWLPRIFSSRPDPVSGIAIWTEGGRVTKCGKPWSYNNNLTVAVSDKSPYKCGQVLKVRNISIAQPKEIQVVVVDQVKGFPPYKINLSKTAFEALGSPSSTGVIEVEITPVT